MSAAAASIYLFTNVDALIELLTKSIWDPGDLFEKAQLVVDETNLTVASLYRWVKIYVCEDASKGRVLSLLCMVYICTTFTDLLIILMIYTTRRYHKG